MKQKLDRNMREGLLGFLPQFRESQKKKQILVMN